LGEKREGGRRRDLKKKKRKGGKKRKKERGGGGTSGCCRLGLNSIYEFCLDPRPSSVEHGCQEAAQGNTEKKEGKNHEKERGRGRKQSIAFFNMPISLIKITFLTYN